jgi:hypothetical protein
MTQPARTTESESRDNAAIRDIMHQIQELTVPDRATLALGLVGHLATLMNSRQIAKLLGQLAEQAANVQDVPPKRRGDAASGGGEGSTDGRTDDGRSHPNEVGAEGRGALTDDAGPIL